MIDAVRQDYDNLAAAYTRKLYGELSGKPFDREILAELAEGTDGPIADLGCGPGQIAAYLADKGAEVVGYDVSPQMIVQARMRRPELRFEVSDFGALAEPADAFAAVVSFYSIVHLEAGQLGTPFREWRRVLRPGGTALVAFHMGTEVVRPGKMFDVEVGLGFQCHEVQAVDLALKAAGFSDVVVRERDPYPGAEHPSRRAYITAR